MTVVKIRNSIRILRTTAVTLLAAGALILAGASDARADLINCGPTGDTDLTDKVHDGGSPSISAVSDCEYVDPPDESNVASIANINTAGFFGFTDWNDNGQTQFEGAGGTGASGTWSIDNFDASKTYIIVFKDGEGTNLIAFLFTNAFSSGGWDTPFVEPPFSLAGGSTSHDVSHYTIAWRDGGDDIVPVPEPALLLLMGIGLAVGGRRLRRRLR